jgi:hypothetical protein
MDTGSLPCADIYAWRVEALVDGEAICSTDFANVPRAAAPSGGRSGGGGYGSIPSTDEFAMQQQEFTQTMQLAMTGSGIFVMVLFYGLTLLARRFKQPSSSDTS